jgi:sporulenol synthase
VTAALARASQFLRRRQESDGRFPFCLEANAITDANVLIAMRLARHSDAHVERRLVARLLEKQRASGPWARYPDDDGDISSSIESYFALLLCGRGRDEPEMTRARNWIRDAGGLDAASSLTRVVLALSGQAPWSDVAAPPIELALAPAGAPLSIYDFASYTRAHLPPLMILSALRFTAPVPPECGLAELRARPRRWPSLGEWLSRGYGKVLAAQGLLDGTWIRRRSIAQCERFLLDRQERDGTLASYILSTIFMIFAFRALGYDTDHPRVLGAWRGLRSLVWDGDGIFHQQPCTSSVWDTALAAQALLEAGAHPDEPALRRAARYLLPRESTEACDNWIREQRAGGWGFQDVNRFYPDVDDTTAVLRVLRAVRGPHASARDHACARGTRWVLAMQNRDGGWSAFDHDSDRWWLERFPLNDMIRAMTDPSSADMTGRTLEFLGEMGLTLRDPRIDRAVRWLTRDQRRDGSWFGRWGIAHIYGTSSALCGLAAVGFPRESAVIAKGVAWLKRIQNDDGGFGESARSDVAGRYVPLGRSTPSQTAWAALALEACGQDGEPSPALRRAIDWLLERQTPDGSWLEDYPTGSGFAGKIYLQYHSYRQVWPMLALARFRRLELAPRASSRGMIRSARD